MISGLSFAWFSPGVTNKYDDTQTSCFWRISNLMTACQFQRLFKYRPCSHSVTFFLVLANCFNILVIFSHLKIILFDMLIDIMWVLPMSYEFIFHHNLPTSCYLYHLSVGYLWTRVVEEDGWQTIRHRRSVRKGAGFIGGGVRDWNTAF